MALIATEYGISRRLLLRCYQYSRLFFHIQRFATTYFFSNLAVVLLFSHCIILCSVLFQLGNKYIIRRRQTLDNVSLSSAKRLSILFTTLSVYNRFGQTVFLLHSRVFALKVLFIILSLSSELILSAISFQGFFLILFSFFLLV